MTREPPRGPVADWPLRPLARRTFLAAAATAGLALLAGRCAAPAQTPTPPTPSPSPPPSPPGTKRPSPSPSPTPSPAITPSPGPSLRERIGQMLLVGFRGLTVDEAEATLADIADHNLGGVLLFDRDAPSGSATRNIQTPAQLEALVAGLSAAARTPLLVAVDEEGGRVARLDERHGFPSTLSAAELGARGNPEFTRTYAEGLARTLADVGITLNLAPVVDLNINPDNPAIGALDRSFSADPEVVTAQARAFVEGHRAVGVRTTLKHFPGHGSSTGDTHLGVVDVTGTWDREELEPYRALLAGGDVDAILTAHVFNRNLDAEHPATLSAATIGGLLRGELGWQGVVISDDLQMGAIREAYGYEEAVRLAVAAGIDILTIAQQQVFEPGIVGTTIDIIEALVEAGQIDEARIDESHARILAFKGV